MPKQKIKRHDRMYAGPYWISTRDGKPNVHRYNPKLDTATECNEAALAGNAIPSLPKAPPVETGRPGASTPEEDGLIALAVAAGIAIPGNIEADPGTAAPNGNAASAGDQDSTSTQGPVTKSHNHSSGILVCADCDRAKFVKKPIKARATRPPTGPDATAGPAAALKMTSMKFNPINSGPSAASGKFTPNAPMPESSTTATAAPAPAKPTVARSRLPKAEAEALAESDGKRRCNRCRVARGLECFVRSFVPYGPITDTHKSCNRCKLTSIRPASRRPSLDKFGRQFLGERDEDEEVDENDEAEAMDVGGEKRDGGSETSLEEYNPED